MRYPTTACITHWSIHRQLCSHAASTWQPRVSPCSTTLLCCQHLSGAVATWVHVSNSAEELTTLWFTQVLQRSSIERIMPFLDPFKDVIVSVEQTRHRLLALSCLCPGASTLIGNLLHAADVSPALDSETSLAGRVWLKEYVQGAQATLQTCRAEAAVPLCMWWTDCQWVPHELHVYVVD